MENPTKQAAVAAFALLLGGSEIAAAQNTATTIRYWDCCKPGAAWSGKASVSNPVNTCAANGVTVVGKDVRNACDSGSASGSAFMCNNQQPWNVSSNVSYGYATASIAGQTEANNACACYALQFTSGPVSGKTMVVQVVGASPGPSGSNFGLLIPGGGTGIFTQGCTAQWGVASPGWGSQYGGVSSLSECSKLPAALRPGCNWRFNWFINAESPNVKFQRVKCPAAITANTGCIRTDDSSFPTAPK